MPLYSENMVLSTELWESWNDEVQMAYTYYANLKGKDAVLIGKGIGFGLKNAFVKNLMTRTIIRLRLIYFYEEYFN